MKRNLEAVLEKYKTENRYSWEGIAELLGLTKAGLVYLLKHKSPKTKISTCLAIKNLTGLDPWEYLDGLDNLKKLKSK
jgi:hypothetical protein